MPDRMTARHQQWRHQPGTVALRRIGFRAHQGNPVALRAIGQPVECLGHRLGRRCCTARVLAAECVTQPDIGDPDAGQGGAQWLAVEVLETSGIRRLPDIGDRRHTGRLQESQETLERMVGMADRPYVSRPAHLRT